MAPLYTIIGTPFSTFTRSITLGLVHKGVEYNQVRVTPHSETADEYHPFGFLPTLVIHDINGKKVDLKLRESQAIARYIDRIHPEPTLHLDVEEAVVNGAPADAIIPEKMWEFVSLAGAFGFPIVEGGCVKKRVAATDEAKLSDAEVRSNIKEGVDKLKFFLSKIEKLMAPDGFVFGKKVTWADFFLFPLLADLRATPEGEVLSPRLKAWMDLMDGLEAVKKTAPGTLSVGARPP